MISSLQIKGLGWIKLAEIILKNIQSVTHEDEDYLLRLESLKKEDKIFEKNILIYYKFNFWISNDSNLWILILLDYHESKVTSYFGEKTTLQLLSYNFVLPNLDKTVSD